MVQEQKQDLLCFGKITYQGREYSVHSEIRNGITEIVIIDIDQIYTYRCKLRNIQRFPVRSIYVSAYFKMKSSILALIINDLP